MARAYITAAQILPSFEAREDYHQKVYPNHDWPIQAAADQTHSRLQKTRHLKTQSIPAA